MSVVEFDPEKCSGCWACTVTCEDHNDICITSALLGFRKVEEDDTIADGGYKFSYKMSGCMHCAEPSCLNACRKHCFSVAENGLVILDNTNCVACKLCIKACPFHAIAIFENKAIKCNGCAERQAAGLRPSCEKICPTGAIRFKIGKGSTFNHNVVEK